MDLTSLFAAVQLSKTFSLGSDKKLVKAPYPQVKSFTSETLKVTSIAQLHACVLDTAVRGGCLLKGTLLSPLKDQSRAGSTIADAGTQWLLLDLDGMGNDFDVNAALKAMGLGQVSYVLQYSASHGIDLDRGFSAHVFMMLSRPFSAPHLKNLLTYWNLTLPIFAQRLRLTRTGAAIRWPLDISTCQNDKLIYVAPPVLGKGVKCSCRNEDRIVLVKKKLGCVPEDVLSPDLSKVNYLKQVALNRLRRQAGLPALRSAQYKTLKDQIWLSLPGAATITGMKQERGFTYFNLNGGDSWGYYHPNEDPQWIHNFKGEPVYATSELLPEYWKQLNPAQAGTTDEPPEDVYFVCRDFKTDRFYNGVYHSGTKMVTMAGAKSESRLKSFLKSHGCPVPEFIPDWDISYDPNSTIRFDPEQRRINTYIPSEFSKLPRPKQCPPLPDPIRRVFVSVFGEDCLERWLNWLACIKQYNAKTGTSWVGHGIQGTGKGIMIERILAPVFGKSNVSRITMRALEERYNGWIEHALLVFVDEVQVSEMLQAEIVMADLRTYITEPNVPIRRMYSETYIARSFANFVFASNMPDPVNIAPTDRRFNIGNYGAQKLELTDRELQEIDEAVPCFYHYLHMRPADLSLARTPYRNMAREQMIAVSHGSAEEVAEAIKKGDIEFFLEQLPDSSDPLLLTPTVLAYRHLCLRLLKEKPQKLTRDELFVIFDYCVGNVPRSPHKFTKYLRHRHLFTKRIRLSESTTMGVELQWNRSALWMDNQALLISPDKKATVIPITAKGKI